MKAIDGFKAAMKRAEYLLNIYDLVCDTRERRVRSDWSGKFNNLMSWPEGENIVRVDGKDKKSILIMREDVGISRDQFTHDYLSELLRATLVLAVSSLDRYMHDLVVERSWSLLNRKEEEIPAELKKIKIPILRTTKALAQLKDDPKSRPGFIVKKAIQDILHREYTFQKPDDIQKAANMLGIKNFWKTVSKKINENDLQTKLKKIAQRRNQIVHEADIVRKTKAREITVREIKRTEVDEDVKWIKKFVYAIDKVLPS